MQIGMNDYIKDKYTFKEVYELQKLPLDTKIKISVEVLRRAFEISKHNIALAFSGGKDSQVVADLAERYLP
jgi:3'-phosphoadenosine 5'-phosphosulfate sulfotransferase (PAPS reductase)/FAD synthetase